MDRIRIVDLAVDTRIGVPAEERARPQTVVISVEAFLDTGPAGKTDDLAKTVDYGEMVAEIARLVRETQVQLLETLAERIADLVLAEDAVTRVEVEVGKEHPPVTEQVGGISVRIERPA